MKQQKVAVVQDSSKLFAKQQLYVASSPAHPSVFIDALIIFNFPLFDN
jgi:hypothetical protein